MITNTTVLSLPDFPLPVPGEYLLAADHPLLAKFVVTTSGALVIGPMRHGLLAAHYYKDPLLAVDISQSLKHAERTLGEEIFSAGAIDHNGKISWGSTGFGITAPPHDQQLAEEIIEKINKAFKK